MPALDRDKALDVALAQIDKQYGKGSVMRLGDETGPGRVDRGVPAGQPSGAVHGQRQPAAAAVWIRAPGCRSPASSGASGAPGPPDRRRSGPRRPPARPAVGRTAARCRPARRPPGRRAGAGCTTQSGPSWLRRRRGASASAISVVSRASSGAVSRLGLSDSAASTSARLVTDFEPGTRTTASTAAT